MIKKYLPLILLIIVIAGVWFSGLLDLFTLENIKLYKSDVTDLYEKNAVLVSLEFMLVYILVVALSLPTASIFTLLAGAVFGVYLGTFLVVLGATIGASIVFLVARSALGEVLRRKAGKFYDKAKIEMDENAFSYLLFLRLVPAFPFFIVNILPALFPIKLRTYIVTTFLGIIPGTFIYVNLGSALGSIDSLSDLITTKTLMAFGLLGVISLVPVLIKKFKK